MLRTSAVVFSLAVFSSTAWAAPQLERVRGTIVSTAGNNVTVKARDGSTKTITLSPDTKFVYVAKSSLDNVTDGKFIGTATKGENPPVALEVVIFPASMKGTGEGHYAWDSITDTTGGSSGMAKSSMTNGTIKSASGSGGMTKSSMTNGTVKSSGSMGKNSMTKSSMTNGTVKSGSASGGGKKIAVTYDNGQSLDITVPPSAPIVEFEPADKSILKPGATLFSNNAVSGDKLEAKLVGVGKDGVTPPM